MSNKKLNRQQILDMLDRIEDMLGDEKPVNLYIIRNLSGKDNDEWYFWNFTVNPKVEHRIISRDEAYSLKEIGESKGVRVLFEYGIVPLSRYQEDDPIKSCIYHAFFDMFMHEAK